MSSDFPAAYFGSAQSKPVNWRELPDDEDPDDDEIQTPEDVVMMLGFDPAKE